MTIREYINNDVRGFQIFDEQRNEYFLIEPTEELAIEKYNAIKFREANPPLKAKTKEEILKEKYKSIDKTKIANADLDKRLKAIEKYLGV